GINGVGVTTAVICCLTSYVNNFANIHQTSFNFRYDIAPTVELRLRYSLDNQHNNYAEAPGPSHFSRPPGYTGSLPNNYTFFDIGNNAYDSKEIDQLYEYDIRARIGQSALRVSYASYNSAATVLNHSGGLPCNACTLSGELTV